MILEVLKRNTVNAQRLVASAIPIIGSLEAPFPSGVHTALEHAIATSPEHRDPAMVRKLDVVAGRVLDKEGWSG